VDFYFGAIPDVSGALLANTNDQGKELEVLPVFKFSYELRVA
jgi:hypothetical protein